MGMARTFRVMVIITGTAPMSQGMAIIMGKEHMHQDMGINMDIAPMHRVTVTIMVKEDILHGMEAITTDMEGSTGK
jgi:hypothetical protein